MTLIGSLLAIATIPIVALALEPADPVGFCSRFIDDKAIENCQTRTSKDNVDWYAAAVCNLQKEDNAFWKCWDNAKDKSYNPQALEKCEENTDFSDDQRQACVDSAASQRRPASVENSSEGSGLFQPLKTKKK